MANYPIRPKRKAHGLVEFSGGGYGAMGLAIKHRDSVRGIATLASPVNQWYDNDKYFENFDPTTKRWKVVYHPKEIVGTFAASLLRVQAKVYETRIRSRSCRGTSNPRSFFALWLGRLVQYRGKLATCIQQHQVGSF